jgi:hypothetical protein
MRKDNIIINEWPTDAAKRAYQNGYYIEALQILHSWIENRLQEHLVLCRHKNFKEIPDEVWEVSKELSLLNVSKTLYIIGKINKSIWTNLRRFNSIRNKLIHRLFSENEEGLEGIPKRDYEDLFELGIKIAELIEFKSDSRM